MSGYDRNHHATANDFNHRAAIDAAFQDGLEKGMAGSRQAVVQDVELILLRRLEAARLSDDSTTVDQIRSLLAVLRNLFPQDMWQPNIGG